MTSIQFRRRLIVIFLLCVAVAGALIRHFSAPGSTRHDIGTVMMLLWLPVIGQVVGWVFGKVRQWRQQRQTQEEAAPVGPLAFDDAAPFAPQLWVELTLRPSSLPAENFAISPGVYGCALVVGTQGFSARWRVEPGEALPRGTPRALQVEFLKPALALPCFAPDTAFRMLVGETFLADGRVLRAL
ncbi:MAG: hypothetical protein EOO29_16750 [Comamonadaceae bacterium]|nr:MAG: hypothetical protein EOO29_16750 [Comamonadaceae bacterium]